MGLDVLTSDASVEPAAFKLLFPSLEPFPVTVEHGLIERAEKDVPIMFLDADYSGDELTHKSLEFSNKIGVKKILYKMENYANVNPLLAPLVLVIPIEWFIYYLAHFNGEDPGSTRHIGKVRY